MTPERALQLLILAFVAACVLVLALYLARLAGLR